MVIVVVVVKRLRQSGAVKISIMKREEKVTIDVVPVDKKVQVVKSTR